MAEIINTYLIFGIKHFNTFFNIEIEHCLFQVGKILNYFEFKKWNEFYFKDGISESNKSKKYLQKSNVFSYFIFRSLILYNINYFLEICFSFNKEHFLKQNFHPKLFIDIIKKTLDDKSFEEIINQKININLKKKNKKFIFNNLRMVCLEYKI